MDEQELRGRLEDQLAGLDWSRGIAKPALAERLGDRALGGVIGRSLPDGVYFSPQDVLNALPAAAWHDLPVAATPEPPVAPVETGARDRASASAAAAATQARQTVGQAAQAVTGSAARVAEQTRERAAAAAQAAAGIADLPGRVRQTASQARDQVLHVRTRAADAPLAEPSPAPAPEPTAVPDARPAVVEGLGQAYNRQPTRALILAALGLTLATLSGATTWLARRLRRDRTVRVGPDRVRPFWLGLGSAAFVAGLWDAWRFARGSVADPARMAAGAASPSSWGSHDAAGQNAAAASPTAATDEFPTVGNA